MHIRQFNQGDIDRCLRMDASYATAYVWHVIDASSEGCFNTRIERTRLPRTIEVAYPSVLADLANECRNSECMLVADHLSQLRGWIDLRTRNWSNTGWIEFCAVDRTHRRKGIGSLLLQSAEEWARRARLRQVIIPLQTKNDEAIAGVVKRGYRYGGFLDRYYTNDDVALLFYRAL
ncbi:MAG: GNAT family N-acetyltransferase [Chloroflexi bacterium]|nr:GNAT family N-acetyltransferase [Chloroflexota bacterium]